MWLSFLFAISTYNHPLAGNYIATFQEEQLAPLEDRLMLWCFMRISWMMIELLNILDFRYNDC